MKDSLEANFPIHFIISYDSKIDKKVCKIKYTQIYSEKYTAL